jgi:hypothetical protein
MAGVGKCRGQKLPKNRMTSMGKQYTKVANYQKRKTAGVGIKIKVGTIKGWVCRVMKKDND